MEWVALEDQVNSINSVNIDDGGPGQGPVGGLGYKPVAGGDLTAPSISKNCAGR